MTNSNRRSYFFIFLLAFTILSCASAKKKFQKGNYKSAYKKALSKLEKNRADRPHQRILIASLEEMMKENDEEIQELDLGEVKGLKKAIRLTEDISEYVDESIPFTGERFVGKKLLLSNQILNYQKNIGGIYLEDAWGYYDTAKQNESKLDYKSAFLSFELASEYDSTIDNLQAYMDTSLTLAQRIVYVEADPGFDIMESWDIDRRFKDVEGYSDRFTKIYFEKPGKKSQADCLIDIEFSNLDFDISTTSSTEYFSERVVTGYNTVTDTSGNTTEEPIYETVEGEVDVVSERKVGEWDIRIQVQGSTNDCEWSSTSFDESIESKIERMALSGDERAIPSRYKNTIEEKHESEDDMSEEIIDNAFRRFVSAYF